MLLNDNIIEDVTDQYNDQEFQDEVDDRYDDIEYNVVVDMIKDNLIELHQLTIQQRVLIGDPDISWEDGII